MFTRVMLVFSFFMSSLALAADTQSSGLKEFLAKLQGMENFQAAFVQTSRAQGGEILQQMQGTLSVAKPGKMRWETEDPYAQLVVSDGQLIWVYDMDLEQVTIRNMDQRVQETPALLLSGDTDQIDASFVVSYEASGKNSLFQLVPKDPSQLFQSLEFHYEGKILQRMMIFDAAGQVTEIAFSEQKANEAIDEQAFIFDVPEGVDVIDGRKSF
ncbi:outer membrane lipoprotein chaperone LolA [Bacterioplanoides sp.]|uniref:outer membrane lipoprotein chaperone LolA n=1 Tax=Bacterioplanoides sp. TaxID=2066072 RepID=UPI003B5BFB1D